MAYSCDLGSGQRLDLSNQGTQTTIAIASSSIGQQQQSSNSLQTGAWISPPEVYRTSEGVVVKLQTDAGNQFIQIQGSHMSLSATALPFSTAEKLSVQQTNIPASTLPPMPSMPPMEPMKPMQPMTMGTMQMNSKPMAMTMGAMEMRMGSESGAANTTPPTPIRQFCTQCGTSVKPSDRFCASCGHQLG
ncbi:zinc ribbon domain-containing protein [Leptolyngbyaceae cyanobacterium UHCC 1019]